MSRSQSLLIAAVAAITLLAAPGQASAQAAAGINHTFSLSLLGGLGGSIDEDGPGFDNSTLQLGGSVVMEGNVEVGVRLGQMDFGGDRALGRLLDAELSYATIAGEYGFGETGYQSSIFIGIGLYQLEGIEVGTGLARDETRVGLTLGVTGDFDLTRRLGIVAELSAHALPSGEAQFFGSALVGVAAYFK